MEAQLQIRHNAQEAQEYVTDLLEWQNTIKRKAPASAAPSSSAPAVRGRADATISAPTPEMQQPALGPKGVSSTAPASSKPASSHPAAHTYKNYSKWDKFNVDEALEEAEADRGPSSSSSTALAARRVPSPANTVPTSSVPPPRSIPSSSSTAGAPSVPAPPRAKEPSTALEWKDRGNKLFQAGQYQPALDCYQRSLALEPTSIAHANAAMALLKLNKHSEAEAACTAALALDPGYVKALQRRGTARKAVGSYLTAAEDFEAALRLEPGNKAVLAERDACLQQHLQQQQLDTSYLPTHTISLVVEPGKPQAVQQQLLDSKQAAAPGLTPVSSSRTPEAAAAAAAAVMQACLPGASRPQGVSTIDGAAADAGTAGAAAGVVGGAADGADGGHMTANGTNRSTTPSPPPAAAAAQAPTSPQLQQQCKAASPAGSPGKAAAAGAPPPVAAAAAAALADKLAGRVLGSFKQPRTSVEFEAAWRALQGDEGLQVRGRRRGPGCCVHCGSWGHSGSYEYDGSNTGYVTTAVWSALRVYRG
jgi:tetratricopeptide (TPR) repeat protein